jgi:hypothetical protein
LTKEHFIYFYLIGSFLLFGCASNPGKISFEQAMYEVGRGLVQSQVGRDDALQQAGLPRRAYGLYPAQVLVTFNVTAGSTISAEGSGSVPSSMGNGALKLAGAWTGNRGNTITIRYQSIFFRQPGQVGTDLSPSAAPGNNRSNVKPQSGDTANK